MTTALPTNRIRRQITSMLCLGMLIPSFPPASLAQESTEKKAFVDASTSYAAIAGQMSIGYVLGKVGFEAFMRAEGLTNNHQTEAMGVWSSRWQGANATGSLSAYASFPSLFDKSRNTFWVVFSPPDETPMPAVMLSHLLSKAAETILSSGDTLDLKLPPNLTPAGCREVHTLTVRVTTGALVRNLLETSCPIKGPTS